MSMLVKAKRWLQNAEGDLTKNTFCSSYAYCDKSVVTRQLAKEGVKWQTLLDNERLERYKTAINKDLSRADKVKFLAFTDRSFEGWLRRMRIQGRL